VSGIEGARIAQEVERYQAQVALPRLLSGDATFMALNQAVTELSRSAPEDHDVLDSGIRHRGHASPLRRTAYIVFGGFDADGHQTFVVCHFSQLVSRVVYLPKRGDQRVITGFARETSA